MPGFEIWSIPLVMGKTLPVRKERIRTTKNKEDEKRYMSRKINSK